MAETLENFFDRVTRDIPPRFSASPWYNGAGDCIHYHWRQDEYYADWVDDKITVYRSIKTNEAVGLQIKGIVALIQKLGDFGVSINEQTDVPLAMFLFASRAASSTDDEKMIVAREKIYSYLLEQVGKVRVQPNKELASACP